MVIGTHRIGTLQTTDSGSSPLPAAWAAPMIPAPIILNEDDRGKTIGMKAGDFAVIMLNDPYVGPYGWSVSVIEGDSVKLVGRTRFSPDDQHRAPEPGDIGPDVACFRLTAVKPGTATVFLVCEPPPELMVPTYLYQVTFAVEP